MAENQEKAILLIAHGSRAADANTAMYRVADDLREGEWGAVECAFLELNEPLIPEGLTRCADAGANLIIAVPYFLHLGKHVKEDLPRIISEWRAANPGIEVRLGNPFGYSPRLTELIGERIAEQLK
jgi:sirohydrochlorin ferrochelatase